MASYNFRDMRYALDSRHREEPSEQEDETWEALSDEEKERADDYDSKYQEVPSQQEDEGTWEALSDGEKPNYHDSSSEEEDEHKWQAYSSYVTVKKSGHNQYDDGTWQPYSDYKTVSEYEPTRAEPKGIGLPRHWNIYSTDEECEIVKLNPYDKRFREIEEKFWKGNCKYSKIERILRIENRSLWIQYQARKQRMEKLNEGEVEIERELWHGTDKVTSKNIMSNGYNRGYAGKNATYYGKGIYFAVNSEYSGKPAYAKPDKNGVCRMILNKVLTGFYTEVDKKAKVLPARLTTRKGDIPYDSAVNDVDDIKMFIIFHDGHAYPAYLVEYRP